MSGLEKGQKVKIIASAQHPPFRSDREAKLLVGKEGVITGRELGELVEVATLGPTNKPYGYLFHPSEVQKQRTT